MGTTITQADLNSGRYIQTDDGTAYKKPGSGTIFGSVCAGAVASGGVTALCKYFQIKASKSFDTHASKMYEYEIANNNTMQHAMEKMYAESPKFGSKGIPVFDYTSEFEKPLRGQFYLQNCFGKQSKSFNEKINELVEKKYTKFMTKRGIDTTFYSEEFMDAHNEFYNKHKLLYKIQEKQLKKGLKNISDYGVADPDKLTKLYFKNPEKALKKVVKKLDKFMEEIQCADRTVERAQNAFQIEGAAFVNMDKKLKFSLPHELGHALNAKSKGLPRLIHSLYNPALKIPGIDKRISLLTIPLCVALFRRKKAEGEESNTFAGKALDFVKDNCVELTAALCAPKLIEEASASIRGVKMMKKYLPKNEMNMLRGFYGRAWLTYFISAAATVGGVWAADRIKNLIDKPKKVEVAQQEEQVVANEAGQNKMSPGNNQSVTEA